MNIKMIKALANIVKDAELTRLEVKEGDLSILITKEQIVQTVAASPVAVATVSSDSATKPAALAEKQTNPGLDFKDLHVIPSPMVGVFYQSSGPGEPPYVQIGSKVKKGDVLCIVEAMKLLNEITAVQDGEIVDICVSDGDIVEYGQTLFKVF